MNELVPMSIKGLMLDPVSNSPIVVLKDEEEKFFLPIWVGIFEANGSGQIQTSSYAGGIASLAIRSSSRRSVTRCPFGVRYAKPSPRRMRRMPGIASDTYTRPAAVALLQDSIDRLGSPSTSARILVVGSLPCHQPNALYEIGAMAWDLGPCPTWCAFARSAPAVRNFLGGRSRFRTTSRIPDSYNQIRRLPIVTGGWRAENRRPRRLHTSPDAADEETPESAAEPSPGFELPKRDSQSPDGGPPPSA